ncbi:chain length determinant family protein, partial [Streptomonospora salina]
GEIAELNKEIRPLAALRSSVVPGRIITPATLPDEASAPVPELWAAAGGVLGLAAGLAAAVGADRRDPRLRTVGGTERAAGTAVLLGPSRCAERADGPAAAPETEREAQEANRAALGLAAGIGDRGTHRSGGAVVLVPGVSPGTDSGAAATRIAAALARVGADVLLVRADLAARPAGTRSAVLS